jgi:hypothetical protein
MKSNQVDAIVALDDYDVEKATYLRENLRIDGMGQTTGRYFRDSDAHESEKLWYFHPCFCSLFNDHDINTFADNVSPPWVLKPRSSLSVRYYKSMETLWIHITEMGNNRFKYLLENSNPELFIIVTV